VKRYISANLFTDIVAELHVPQVWPLSYQYCTTVIRKMEVHMAYFFLQVDSFHVGIINELQRHITAPFFLVILVQSASDYIS
jgi:hypothetical protein